MASDTPGSPLMPPFEPPKSSGFAEGDTIPEDVEIIRDLGSNWRAFAWRSGGMGEVYLCIPAKGSRIPFALKSFAPSLVFDPATRRAFERECAVAIRLAVVPGIHQACAVEYIDGRPYLVSPAVMPDSAGVVNLRDLLDRRQLRVADALFYALFIAHSLETASILVPGIVHGDLKPENFLMVHGLPHVSDFGLARVGHESLQGDVLLTSPDYAAPEITGSRAQFTGASDIYAYGVILAEMLAHAIECEQPAEQELRAALGDLAHLCASAGPGDRPNGFGQVRAELTRLTDAGKWAIPASAWAGFMLLNVQPVMNVLLYPEMVRSLIALARPDLALDMISTWDEDSLSVEMLTLKGVALSKTGRHEQAMERFKRARSVSQDADQSWEADHQYATCLKRLERLDEAAKAFEWLIALAPDESRTAHAVAGLGTVLIDAGRYREAAALLRNAIRSSPNHGVIYANLSIVYERLGDYDRAISFLRDAVRHEPSVADYHKRLGCLFMDRTGNIADARAAFNTALYCGDLEIWLLARCLSCAVLTADNEYFNQIIRQAERAYGAEEADLLTGDAAILAALHMRRFAQPAAELEQRLSPEAREELDRRAAELAGPPETAAEGDDYPAGHVESAFMHAERATEGFLVYDFYYPFDAKGYAEIFAIEHRTAATVAAAKLDAYLRGAPAVLTRCQQCGEEITTNRSAGSLFPCRACGQPARVEAMGDETAAPRLADLAPVLGTARDDESDDGSYTVMAVVQPTAELSDAQQIAARYAARLYGMEPLLTGHSGLITLFKTGIEQGLFVPERPVLGAVRRYAPGDYSASGGTPADVDEYLLAVRLLLREAMPRISQTFHSAGGGFAELMMQGNDFLAEELLRSQQGGPADAQLWAALGMQSLYVADVDGAERRLRQGLALDDTAVKVWTALGRLRLFQGQLDSAMAAAARAFQLDPADSDVVTLLADCERALLSVQDRRDGDQRG